MARGDIRLPNESGRVDPRIATAELDARRTRERSVAVSRQLIDKKKSNFERIRDGWRSFTAKGRR